MKRAIQILLAAAVIILGAMDAMAIEEATYTVVKKDHKFEIRDYAPHILAETVVEGDLEGAGNKALPGFRAATVQELMVPSPSPYPSINRPPPR